MMLSLPSGRAVVMHWADEGGLMATALQPVIAVVPSRNSTLPAGLVLSDAETVAVKVTDWPKVMLVELGESAVVVPVAGAVSWTVTADEVEPSTKLAVAVPAPVSSPGGLPGTNDAV